MEGVEVVNGLECKMSCSSYKVNRSSVPKILNQATQLYPFQPVHLSLCKSFSVLNFLFMNQSTYILISCRSRTYWTQRITSTGRRRKRRL